MDDLSDLLIAINQHEASGTENCNSKGFIWPEEKEKPGLSIIFEDFVHRIKIGREFDECRTEVKNENKPISLAVDKIANKYKISVSSVYRYYNEYQEFKHSMEQYHYLINDGDLCGNV